MAVEFLHELKVPFFKVGSGDTNNFPYLEKTAKKGKRIVTDAFCELQQLENKEVNSAIHTVVCTRTSHGGV